MQHGAVKEECCQSSTLSVSGKFPSRQGKIAASVDLNFLTKQSRQHESMFAHDVVSRLGDVARQAVQINFQNEGIVQAARTLQHRSAPAVPAKNGNGVLRTPINIHFFRQLVRGAENHKILFRFPEAKDLVFISLFHTIEQRFVAREVFFRGWKGMVDELQWNSNDVRWQTRFQADQ